MFITLLWTLWVSMGTLSAETKESQSNDHWTHSKGLFTSSVGLDSSLGFQRYHHGIGGWWQQCPKDVSVAIQLTGNPRSCWQLDIHLGFDAQTIPETTNTMLKGTMVTTHVATDILRGITLGKEAVQIGLFGGIGGDLYIGGIEQLAWSIRPSLLTEVQIQIPVADAHLLWLSGGHRIGLHRANPSISIGWGSQW